MRNQPQRSMDALGLVPGGSSLSSREERDLLRATNHLSARGLAQAHAAQVDGYLPGGDR